MSLKFCLQLLAFDVNGKPFTGTSETAPVQQNTDIAISIFHLLVVVIVIFNALVVNELFSAWHVLGLEKEVSFTG